MKNMVIFEPRGVSLWSNEILEKSWERLSEKQMKDERRYTDSLLGFGSMSILFRAGAKEDLGNRNKDFLYGCWTEEDIRLKLAAEILEHYSAYSQVHGQVHIRGNQRRKARKHSHNYRVSIFPDLLLILFKERQVCRTYKEKNLETAATEIKYYPSGKNRNDLKKSISRDLNKLINYQARNFYPRVDCGFFFCIDESGEAKNVLYKLFRYRKYRNKNKPLGYGVIVPNYADRNMSYPACLENYENLFERRIYYLTDYVRAQMGKLTGSRILEDEYYFWFKLRNQSIRWIAFQRPINAKGKYLVVVRLRPNYKWNFPKYHRYIWERKQERYIQSDKPSSNILIYEVRKSSLDNIANIEKQGDRIIKVLKKFT